MELGKSKFLSEEITLPSKGKLYPAESPLSKGKVEIKEMTAREEDILTSRKLISDGQVIDRLLQSLIVTPIDYTELLTGDKNAIMVAARVFGYGKDYKVDVECPDCKAKNNIVVDLTTLTEKDIDMKDWEQGVNEFSFELPVSKVGITFRLTTHKIEKDIDNELKSLKKIAAKTGIDSEITTRLRNVITAVNGDSESKTIRNFVDNDLLARDSFGLREHIKTISPDIDMDIMFTCNSCGYEELMMMPMDVGFFWPSSGR